MANYYSATIVFSSKNPIVLGSLFYKVKIVNDYHRGSIDILLHNHGYTDTQIEQLNDRRNYISYCDDHVKRESDGSYTLTIGTQTAWCFYPEVFKDLLTKKYRDAIKFYYLGDDGSDVFSTNDKEGKYFPERYFVDWSTSEDGDSELQITENDVLTYIQSIFPKAGIDASCTIKTAVDKVEQIYGKDENYFLNVHEYLIDEEFIQKKEVA